MTTRKDEKLKSIVEDYNNNVAKFVSVTPQGNISYNYSGVDSNQPRVVISVILDLIRNSRDGMVNIRSFSEESMKGNKLVYGKKEEDIEEIMKIIRENMRNGKYSIVNETIDINDGGVSGVVLGDFIEFSPNDTPKCVEKDGVCHMDKNMGYSILKKVYGFSPDINFYPNQRVEFSIHPKKEGIKKSNTLIWEYEDFDQYKYEPRMHWPNNFSRFIGDKVFGLLVADFLGCNVPYTTVISRNVPPFSFGKKTGSNCKWIRTAPFEKEAGKYFSGNCWQDPFILMNEEESKGNNLLNIASILSQSEVEAEYSGASIVGFDKEDSIVEGVKGNGDDFMLGRDNVAYLPDEVKNKVVKEMDRLRGYHEILGDISFEWVYDGDEVWIVQLNQINSSGSSNIIVEGEPLSYLKFDMKDGIEKLREIVKEIEGKKIGIELIGNIGICSHLGDILRHANIPSFITRI